MRARDGRRDNRPDRLLADRGYDSRQLSSSLAQRGIDPHIVKRNPPGKGRVRDPESHKRWTIERTNAWLHNWRRISTRWERRPDLYLALLRLACSMILTRRLQGSF